MVGRCRKPNLQFPPLFLTASEIFFRCYNVGNAARALFAVLPLRCLTGETLFFASSFFVRFRFLLLSFPIAKDPTQDIDDCAGGEQLGKKERRSRKNFLDGNHPIVEEGLKSVGTFSTLGQPAMANPAHRS